MEPNTVNKSKTVVSQVHEGRTGKGQEKKPGAVGDRKQGEKRLQDSTSGLKGPNKGKLLKFIQSESKEWAEDGTKI